MSAESAPLVSIIVSASNDSDLHGIFTSLRKQTFMDAECILTGCRDGLPALALTSGPGVVCRQTPKARSEIESINTAVALAAGKYIALAGSDTAWMPERLARQVDWLEQHAECAATFSLHDGLEDVLAPGLQFGHRNRTPEEWIRLFWDHGPCLSVSSMLLRRSVLQDGALFDETLAPVHEAAFLLHLCTDHTIHVLEQPLVRRERSSACATHFDSGRGWEDAYYALLRQHLDSLPDQRFARAFQDVFAYPAAHTPEELKVERALLLARTAKRLTPAEDLLDLQAIADLVADPACRSLLQTQYHRYAEALRPQVAPSAAAGAPADTPSASAVLSSCSGRAMVQELMQRIRRMPTPVLLRTGGRLGLQLAREQGRRALQRLRSRRSAAPLPTEEVASLVGPGRAGGAKPIRILFVGIGNSMHTYRWVGNLVRNPKYALYFHSTYTIPEVSDPFSPHDGITFNTDRDLKAFIEEVRPHIVHTMHTQQAAYPMARLAPLLRKLGALWLHSLWGSDLYFWGRFPEHKGLLRDVLCGVDILLTEGRRDVALARNLGFEGRVVDSMPAFGGFDLEKLDSINRSPPSARKEICIKGYMDVVGRFFVGLRALEKVRDLLDGYTINVFSMSPPSRYVAELFGLEQNLRVRIIEHVSHDHMFAMFARSRIFLGVSLSDGLPASLVEGMAMGAFPVQTHTSIADEWIEDRVSGLLIPPNDPDIIAEALRKALTDDALVDEAARINQRTIRERMDRQVLSRNILALYDEVSHDLSASGNLGAVRHIPARKVHQAGA